MRIKDLLLIGSIGILLNGCFATTSANLEQHNFMNTFNVNKNYKDAAQYTYEMFQICRNNNLLTYETKVYENVKKAEVNAYGKITIFGGTNYWTKIDFQEKDNNSTNIRIYSYINRKDTRKTTKMVENWLVNNSKKCDSKAFY